MIGKSSMKPCPQCTRECGDSVSICPRCHHRFSDDVPSTRDFHGLRYSLRLTASQVIGFFVVLAFMVMMAAFLLIFGPKEPILFRGRLYSPGEVARLGWVTLALCALMLPDAFIVSWKGLFVCQRIEIAMDGIWLPKSYWSSQHVLVPFSDIRGVRLHAYAGGRDMKIKMPFRRFMIRESWLPTPAAFDDIYAALNEGIAAAKQAEPGVGAASR